MPIHYGNANYRKKYDAFQIVDKSGHEPLQQAIACALQMRQERDKMVEHGDSVTDPELAAKIAFQVSKALPDEFHAWIKVAEFIYAKPKQKLEVSGNMTLEGLLAGTWGDRPIDLLAPEG